MSKVLQLNHLSMEEADRKYKLQTPRDLFKQRLPTINGGNSKEKMEEIRNYIHNTMDLYEKVFECLSNEDAFYVQPIHKLRHPMIFYYGHTAAFYINKLCVAGLTTRINPEFEKMFAIGVDEMSWDDLDESHYKWPSVQDVCSYRQLVRDRVDSLIQSNKYTLEMPLTIHNSTKNDANAFWWVMLMSAEHERIHVETASVHVRELPLVYIKANMSSFWQRCPHVDSRAPANELISVAGGSVWVGRDFESAVYGWDCDYSNRANRVEVAPFKASKYVVSNAEFFAFIKADGYNTRRYWDEEGWRWVQWRHPTHPWFWVKDETRPDGYALRLQTELINLPWNWPCEMNHLEARAFCNFKSETTGKHLRMLTEEEWLLLFDRYVKQDVFAWGSSAPGNLNLEHYQSSCPVDEFQHGDLYDVVGNVWQHCETYVYPYPGFAVQPFYDDFSLPTFDGRHACMKGGAWVSTGNEATRDARFAFRRHFFQYIGLRYVESDGVEPRQEQQRQQQQQQQQGRLYSNASDNGNCVIVNKGLGLDPEVDVITDSNYRESFAGISNGCKQIAEYAMQMYKTHVQLPPERAMDIACGAGRVSFELTELFEQVIGVDYTARRLVPAFAIRERGQCQYSVAARRQAAREAQSVDAAQYTWNKTRECATFYQSDPTNLHGHLTSFSLIVCWNCLERSYRPSVIPSHLLERLKRGGMLVIGGDYNWDNIKSSNEVTKASTRNTSQHNTSESSYVEDELIRKSASSNDIESVIFDLLGGVKAVKRVDKEVKVIPVAFPDSESSGKVRLIRLVSYIKLETCKLKLTFNELQ